jgi:hypothetical protein
VKETQQRNKEREERKAVAQARMAAALKEQEDAIMKAVVAKDTNGGVATPDQSATAELEARAMQEERRRATSQVCAPPSFRLGLPANS